MSADLVYSAVLTLLAPPPSAHSALSATPLAVVVSVETQGQAHADLT